MIGSQLRPQDVLRPVIPAGLLDLLRQWRAFRRIHGEPLRALGEALRPSRRGMRMAARLDDLPDDFFLTPPVIVDVGAERGIWSEAVLTLADPASLISVEPTPASFRELQARIARFPNARAVQAAVGSKRGKATLHVMTDSRWNSLLPVREEVLDYYSEVGERERVEVDVWPLDEILREIEHVDLLKVDVQGYEEAVLDGGRETLSRTELVMLEANFVSHYEGDRLFADLDRLMRDRGFALLRYADPHYEDGQWLYADAIYRRAARSAPRESPPV